MTTAGYSTSEVARFASAELLRRAWFTLPLCKFFRSVQVCVASTITLLTVEVVAITGAERPTLTDTQCVRVFTCAGHEP